MGGFWGEGKGKGEECHRETERNFYLFLLKLVFLYFIFSFHDATVDSCTCEHILVHMRMGPGHKCLSQTTFLPTLFF